VKITNYTDLRRKLLVLIDGDEAGGSIANSTLDLLIALGESRVYAGDDGVCGLRAASMESALSLPVTNNAATLPADCLELIRVQAGDTALDYLPETDVMRLLRQGGSGDVRFYTQQGNALVFYPEAAGTVTGRYYARPVDLKDALHATFAKYPECFLFAALAESAPFLGEDDRLPMWKQLWASWMRQAQTSERNRATAGSRLTIRNR
jgi:hypothetical protein